MTGGLYHRKTSGQKTSFLNYFLQYWIRTSEFFERKHNRILEFEMQVIPGGVTHCPLTDSDELDSRTSLSIADRDQSAFVSEEIVPTFRRRVKNTKALKGKVFESTIMSSTEPLLRWGDNDNRGITSSGWNLKKGAHISFKNESATKGKFQFIIEPPVPSTSVSIALFLSAAQQPFVGPTFQSQTEANGYFFEKNRLTGMFGYPF